MCKLPQFQGLCIFRAAPVTSANFHKAKFPWPPLLLGSCVSTMVSAKHRDGTLPSPKCKMQHHLLLEPLASVWVVILSTSAMLGLGETREGWRLEPLGIYKRASLCFCYCFVSVSRANLICWFLLQTEILVLPRVKIQVGHYIPLLTSKCKHLRKKYKISIVL